MELTGSLVMNLKYVIFYLEKVVFHTKILLLWRWRNMATKRFKHVYQFKIQLKDIKPPIYRIIEVPEYYTFWDFHEGTCF